MAKTYDTEDLGAIIVNKWIEMPKAFQDEMEIKGFPMGNIACVYGKPDTGKTTMLMTASRPWAEIRLQSS